MTEDIFVKSYSRHNKWSLKSEQIFETQILFNENNKAIKETNGYFKYCGTSLGLLKINGKPYSLLRGIKNSMYQIQNMNLATTNMIMMTVIKDLDHMDLVGLFFNNYLLFIQHTKRSLMN